MELDENKKTMYNCPRCGYNTCRKSSIRDHYKRKKICKPKLQDLSPEYCMELLYTSNEEMSVIKRLEKENEYLKQQLKEKDEQIKRKDEQLTVLTLKTGNNNNNKTYNITNNINIIAFKDTNYNLLTKDILNLLNDPDNIKVPLFERFVQKIHFDRENPSNHNVYKNNKSNDEVMIYDGEQFIVDKRAIESILTKLENTIENNLNNEEHKIQLKKLREHLKRRGDPEYTRGVEEGMNLTLYNNRRLTKETHKKNIIN
jgi:hypothetical protein